MTALVGTTRQSRSSVYRVKNGRDATVGDAMKHGADASISIRGATLVVNFACQPTTLPTAGDLR